MAAPTTDPIGFDVASGLVRRAAQTFDDHDAQGFTAVMAPDVHSSTPQCRSPCTAEPKSREPTLSCSEAFPDLTIVLMDGPLLHGNAPRVVVDRQVRGTHVGRLDPLGLTPTRRGFATVARELVTIENGLARRIT